MRTKTVCVHSCDKIHWCCSLLFRMRSVPLILWDRRPLRQARELEESVSPIPGQYFCQDILQPYGK